MPNLLSHTPHHIRPRAAVVAATAGLALVAALTAWGSTMS